MSDPPGTSNAATALNELLVPCEHKADVEEQVLGSMVWRTNGEAIKGVVEHLQHIAGFGAPNV